MTVLNTHDAIDEKLLKTFPGRVVRKDLVKRIKVGANIPVYVLEYLLGKYCSSADPKVVEEGIVQVKQMISERFVRADESEKIKSLIRRHGTFKIIDKIRAKLDERADHYWAELLNMGQNNVHIPESFIDKYDRLLGGGFWALLEVEYVRGDEEEGGGGGRPFHIRDIKPIQLATCDISEYRRLRSEFTTEEWIDVLIRSLGLDSDHFDLPTKLLLLIRLIPMVERNYNLAELGPRATGKSYVYKELCPYSILISGGKTTVANLFYNLARNKIGLVGLWDVVAFDEVSGIEFEDKTAVQILKDYMESGSFSRGKELVQADASVVFAGNINTSVDVLTKTSHLFQPFPQAMQDMAFIDRLHYYLPGWRLPKMQTEFFTSRYGFVVDYLAEVMRELRKVSYVDAIEKHFALGKDLNARDVKAVNRTISGFLKLLHPDEKWTKDELRTYLELALEGRRRVKEQLKKMGSFEFYQTSFSYIDREDSKEHWVGVPEEGGSGHISPDPLPSGAVYTAALADDRVSLHRIEVTKIPGSGKLSITGNPGRHMRDSIKTAFDYVQARMAEIGIEQDVIRYDYRVQVVDLMRNENANEAGVAFFVALYSAIKDRPVQAGLIIVGQMTIQGALLPVKGLTDRLQLGRDNGAKKVLVPTAEKRHLLEVPGDIMEKVDPMFYSDPLNAALKALGVS